jgi:hypothetical protein
MPGQSPLFSIVIPTRNRAHVLPNALLSALEQDFDDYEIVVVANNCQDTTRDIVKGMRSQKICYFETERTLSMPDNWDFSWTKARGKYVIYLPDDDAMVPSALGSIADAALDKTPTIVSWEDAPYYYPDWHDPAMQNLLLVFFHGDVDVEDVPMSVYRKQCATFSFDWSSPLPKMLNCAANREALDVWRGKLGRLFFPIAPDYSFAWIVSHVFPTIRVLHRPLTVRGISDISIGSRAGLGEATREFLREFGDFDPFAGAPVRIPISTTYLRVTFELVSRMLREHGVTPERVELERFLLAAARQLREAKGVIEGWEQYLPELRTVAASVSPVLRGEVEAIISEPDVERTETIRQIRSRTAQMALEYPPNLQNTAETYLGDLRCARCALGLENGVLASHDWETLYVFGEEVGVYDPYTASQKVDAYHTLLTTCRRKRHLAAARAR